ncbi:MAG: DUF4249 family protein [Bacteroidales bacterium]
MKVPIIIRSGIIIFCISSVILCSTYSCTKLISDEFPEFEEIPTVNALIEAGEIIKVHVSLSGKIDTTEIKAIDNATVILKSNQVVIDTLDKVNKGLYTSNYVAKEGVRYDIEVLLEGFDIIHGSDMVPKLVSAEIFEHTNQFRYDEEGNFTEGIGIKFYDNPNSIDYYEISLIRKKHGSAYYVYPYNNNAPIILNEGFEPYTTPSLVFSDQLIQDSVIRLFLDFYQGLTIRNHGDSLVQIFDAHTMVLEFRHISENYYNYKKHFYLYSKDRYPGFIEGTASYYQNYSNVENGLGIIGAFSVTRDSIWIPEEHLPAK